MKYWHTLRHLKPVQFYGRLTFRYLRPRPNLACAPPLAGEHGPWSAPTLRAPGLAGPGLFDLLGVQGDLALIGWDGPERDKLWRYNQHYFDDLNAAGAVARHGWHLDLLADWVACNRPGAGNGWEPYPCSLRIVNWIKWLWAGNALPPAALHSLAVQARWLGGRLERHLLGNHLFCNAKALLFAGLAHRGPEAQAWLARALAIIDEQLPEQILADGGNFERSPMYHAIFLDDVLDLINAAQRGAGRIDADHLSRWRATAARMLAWLDGMTHPDGGIALFNDAALNVAPTLEQLRQYAARVGVAMPQPRAVSGPVCTRWPDSGYVRLDAGPASAFLDVAPVGPDYLPGHAHADTLSFELSLFGSRVIVNGGTSCYGLSAQRTRERGTAAHSTVLVENADSSEVWGGFRVARRARPFDYAQQREGDAVSVACSHDGYTRLPGKPVHRRTWTMADGCLDVRDHVSAAGCSAQARYIFHPSVRATQPEPGHWLLALADGRRAAITLGQGAGRLEPAQYAPDFGTIIDTTCLVVQLERGSAALSLTWHPH